MNWNNTTLYDFLYSEKGYPNIPIGWRKFFTSKKVKEIIRKIVPETRILISDGQGNEEYEERQIFPILPNVFRAFHFTKLRNIRLIIVGQDCYHNLSKNPRDKHSLGNCAATGLCFDVNDSVINPSLQNIYKKMEAEGFYPKRDGNLEYLAKQGVLLLNMTLSVEQGQPNSHLKLWISFRNEVISYIDGYFQRKNKKVIWLLMGANAHAVKKIIGDSKSKNAHYICRSHPSPLGCDKKCGEYLAFSDEALIFGEINRKLFEWGQEPIKWNKD
jgi:uracil-DNA glycosylase